MLIGDFKRVLTAFADNPAEIDLTKGNLLVQVRDELIGAKLVQAGGELSVVEEGQTLAAHHWLVNRIARLPLLADRILSYVPEVPGFITPSGRLLDQLDVAPSVEPTPVAAADAAAIEVLSRRPAGTTSVLYLTSDAGEGKTTLINHLARHQATEFKAKRANWLLVPIPLGGRAFLRFDDVTVAALVNRLRFQLLYYDAFIELVRLGVLVPAFDGFEEMIVSSSSGEAISALGNLVKALGSSGSVLIAARKAYFDYHSFKAQARLFDAIGADSVNFARLSLDRWDKGRFLEYAQKRGLDSAGQTYEAVADRLKPDHPLLTRAVLVRRLVDVASGSSGLDDLLAKIGSSPQHYFFQFVNALVEREAHEKWIDQSGEPHEPLLTIEEHHELLGMVAQEMWVSSTDTLRLDVLGALAEVFAESRGKSPGIARQLCERLKDHSLLVVSNSLGGRSFDHEDFRSFYLGEALGRLLKNGAAEELASVLSLAVLPRGSAEEALLHNRRHACLPSQSLAVVQKLADSHDGFSLVRENCGSIAIGMAEWERGVTLRNLTFPEDSLRGRTLRNVTITDSYFHGTSLAGTTLADCSFTRCRFERLEVPSVTDFTAELHECTVTMVVREDRDSEQLFDPSYISSFLNSVGLRSAASSKASQYIESDDDLWLVERTMRLFLRTNRVNENVIRARLGVKSSYFLSSVLPQLLAANLLQLSDYAGQGTQRRFKMGVQMQAFHDALERSAGDFKKFMALLERQQS